MKVFCFHDEMKIEGILRAGLDFAKEKSQKGLKHVSIFCKCNFRQSNGPIHTKMFSQIETKKLRSGNTIIADGISIKLESPRTFGEYKEYEVVLGLPLSTSSLNKVEKMKILKS